MCAHHSTEIDQMSVWQAATESGNDYYVVFLPLPLPLHCIAWQWRGQCSCSRLARSWSARRRVGSLDEALRCRRGSEGEEASKAGSPCADHLRVCRNEIPVRSLIRLVSPTAIHLPWGCTFQGARTVLHMVAPPMLSFSP